MKFFAVFAALIAVACGYQATWTLQQLSDALQNPNTDPALVPHLEHALNELMEQMFAGKPVAPVVISIPAVDLSTWSLHDLSLAIENPETDPVLMPYLVEALNQMMASIVSGDVQPVVSVVAPAMDVTAWSLHDLSEAIGNPETHPALIPYLEHALNEIMEALFAGHQMEAIVVATPAGLLPIIPEVIPVEVPVVPELVPAPVEEVVAPSPASPLVQIIVNVNAQAAVAAPSPAVTPEAVVDKPEPIQVVEEAAEPIIVVDNVVPEPVIVVDPIVVPTPVIVSPEINPVDVISVNPIDVMHPIVVNPVIVAGEVGPMV